MTQIDVVIYMISRNGDCGKIRCTACPFFAKGIPCLGLAMQSRRLDMAKEYLMQHYDEIPPTALGALL